MTERERPNQIEIWQGSEFADFATGIKAIRDAEGLSQEEFGNRVGVWGRHVSTYETNATIDLPKRKLPRFRTLQRISREFGVDIIFKATPKPKD